MKVVSVMTCAKNITIPTWLSFVGRPYLIQQTGHSN